MNSFSQLQTTHTTQTNQPSISSRPDPTRAILQRVDEQRESIYKRAAQSLAQETVSQGVTRVLPYLKPEAARVLKGANTWYGRIDDPFGAILVALLDRAGINGTTYYAGACAMLSSEPLGTGPQEKLGLNNGQYQFLESVWKKDQEFQRIDTWPVRTEQERAAKEALKEALRKELKGILDQCIMKTKF